MHINSVEIEDTFAEAFKMRGARLIITAANQRWALMAAQVPLSQSLSPSHIQMIQDSAASSAELHDLHQSLVYTTGQPLGDQGGSLSSLFGRLGKALHPSHRSKGGEATNHFLADPWDATKATGNQNLPGSRYHGHLSGYALDQTLHESLPGQPAPIIG